MEQSEERQFIKTVYDTLKMTMVECQKHARTKTNIKYNERIHPMVSRQKLDNVSMSSGNVFVCERNDCVYIQGVNKPQLARESKQS